MLNAFAVKRRELFIEWPDGRNVDLAGKRHQRMDADTFDIGLEEFLCALIGMFFARN